MHSLFVQKEINAPLHRTWPLLDNFADTYVYHPIVEKSEAVNGIKKGLGARRQCTMYDGNAVQEEIVKHSEHHHRYQVRVVDHGPFPMKHMELWVEVEPRGEQRCAVTYRGGFVPKYGVLGWLMAKIMMKPMFSKMLSQLIDGVETHLRTGKVVGKGGKVSEAPPRLTAAEAA